MDKFTLKQIGLLFTAIALATNPGACSYGAGYLFNEEGLQKDCDGPSCVIGQLIALLGFDTATLAKCSGSISSMMQGFSSTPIEVMEALYPFGDNLLADLQCQWDSPGTRTPEQTRQEMRECVEREIVRRGIAELQAETEVFA